VRRDQERNWRERQRTFEKVKTDSYMFLKKRNLIGREELDRNRNVHEERFDRSKGIGKELKGLETLS